MNKTESMDNRGWAQEYAWVVLVSLAIMLLASVPYIIGYAIAPDGYRFIGFTHNADDAFVYLSWMRQAADGHFFQRNLFTTEPQTGHGFNLFFFATGTFARVTHLPLTAVYHVFRIVCGMALLVGVYIFSGFWLKEVRQRQLALMIAGLSSGLGWLLPHTLDTFHRPVDMWQPEAITFLSVYLSPLFSLPTLLMVGAFYYLYRFVGSGSWRYPVFAGLVLLVLGNVHTYDLIPIAVAWVMYAVYGLIRNPRMVRPITGGLVAALIALPALGYQAYVLATETVFKARVAVPTLSPSIVWYLVGYGLLVPLALLGAWRAAKERRDISLLIFWVIAGFIAAYLPVSFQRKLIMGTHIPMSILAVMGLWWVMSRVPASGRFIASVLAVGLLIPSNISFMNTDIRRVQENTGHTTAHVPFVSVSELGTLAYLDENTRPSDVILAPPGLAAMIPGYAGRHTYAGHWGETKDFQDKLRATAAFYAPDADDAERREFLRDSGVCCVVAYHECTGIETQMQDFRQEPVPYLEPVFETDEVSVYKVAKEDL